MGAFEFGSSAKVGDLTSDSGIDALDLFIAQSVWGPPTGVGTVYGDQNGDNRFNARDLLILEYAWRKLD
jgi:hypothetical protein